MGLLSSVGRPSAVARPRAITRRDTGPGDEERPGAGRTGREAGTGPAVRTVHLRGSPGLPGPSIARGRATTSGLGGNVDKGTRARGPRTRVPHRRQSAQAVGSSTVRLRVRFGSTGMPGPMVVETVTFFRYRPLAAAGLARRTSSRAAA